MAKKRKSSEMVPQASSPDAPTLAGQLQHDWESFCHDAKISLPNNHLSSPPKKPDDLKYLLRKTYGFLWWQNKSALFAAINDFWEWLNSTPNSTSEEVKVVTVLEKLEGPTKVTKVQCLTPRTNRVLDTVPEPTQPDDPPSPTPIRGKGKDITAHFTATKSGVRSRPESDSTVFHSAKTSIAPAAGANTSFTTAATKSFGWSFQSSVGPGTQDTANTSFSSIAPPSRRERDSDYKSSLSSTTRDEWITKMQEVESSQKTRSTDTRPRRGLYVSSDQSQTDSQTTYGSSIGVSDFEEAEQVSDQRMAGGYCWQKRDSGVDEDDIDMTDARIDSPKRLKLGPLHLPAEVETSTDMQQACFYPASTFAQLEIPGCFSELPFHVQWEAQYLLQTGTVTAEMLRDHWRSRSLHGLYELASRQNKSFVKTFDPTQAPDFTGLLLRGKLQFAFSGNGVLFDLKLEAPIKGNTTDLQRQFGCDRILVVDMPDLNKPPEFLKGKNLAARVEAMAASPQTFLGRQWVLILVKNRKQGKKAKGRSIQKSEAFRLFFLAVDEAVTLHDVMSYMLPLSENADQPARKVYSRIELYTSVSLPGMTFDPEDVVWGVQDQYATSDASDTRFLDPALESEWDDRSDSKKEMSDGCSEISFWAMSKIADELHYTEVPVAVQGRFYGSKGVWFRQPSSPSDYVKKGSKPPGSHLKIAKTQIKVKRKSLEGCQPGILTLNVKSVNGSAKASFLYTTYLPILRDRGVSEENIFEVVSDNISDLWTGLPDATRSQDPMVLRRWMHTRNERREDRDREGGIQTACGFAKSLEERIIQMLEAGFVPRQDAFLARAVLLMIKSITNLERKAFKIPLARSTSLFGIADRTGCLEPGEVHVHFSTNFKDSITGESWPALDDMDGLVARNPALAPWDIQKVRFVFRRQLFHLPNVVIFSAKGKRSLAELLQGGDFDGDKYWLCWDPRLVAQFKNAPAPWEPPRVEDFGIQKDHRKLRYFVGNSHSQAQWCSFFAEMAAARMQPDILGKVTRLYERLVYLQGGLNSKLARQILYLHDHLVDADKQGYNYPVAAYDRYKRTIGLPPNLPNPRHWKYTKADDDNDDKNSTGLLVVKGNIIDDVLFKVVEPTLNAVRMDAEEPLRLVVQADPHLARFFDETLQSAGDDSWIRTELKALEKALKPVRETWQTHQNVWKFDELVARLRTKYTQIRPVDASHPTVVEWLRPQGHDLTMWEKLKASAFARFHYQASTPGNLVFNVAGRELCILKSYEVGQSRVITQDAWCNLKINKRPKRIEVATGDEDAEEYAEVMDDGGGMEVDVGRPDYF